MLEWQQEAANRARTYATNRGLDLAPNLRFGWGYDGIVLGTRTGSAIKSLGFERLYVRERDVYLRLGSQQVDSICGFAVPRLLGFDDELWCVEMEIVSPPFVLDFAGAYLDRRPDYPDEVMEEWQQEKLEQFGAERWEVVQDVMAHFARMGIYLADVKPGNIMFAESTSFSE
jgi:hypothetical protein